METTQLKIDMAEQKKDISYIKERIGRADEKNEIEHLEIKTLLKEFIESAEAKYAPIWTATALKYVMTTVFGALILAGLTLILK